MVKNRPSYGTSTVRKRKRARRRLGRFGSLDGYVRDSFWVDPAKMVAIQSSRTVVDEL